MGMLRFDRVVLLVAHTCGGFLVMPARGPGGAGPRVARRRNKMPRGGGRARTVLPLKAATRLGDCSAGCYAATIDEHRKARRMMLSGQGRDGGLCSEEEAGLNIHRGNPVRVRLLPRALRSPQRVRRSRRLCCGAPFVGEYGSSMTTSVGQPGPRALSRARTGRVGSAGA